MLAMYNSNLGTSEATAVRTGGDENYYDSTYTYIKNGALVCMPNSSPFIFADRIRGKLSDYTIGGSKINMKQVKWAIGGFSLLLNDSTMNNATTYHNFLMQNEWASSAQAESHRPRTAMFYVGGGATSENVILLTVFNDQKVYSDANPQYSSDGTGLTYWELRECIKTKFPAATTHGIILDGGGSTGITYNVPGLGFRAQAIAEGSSSRDVYNMVVTPM